LNSLLEDLKDSGSDLILIDFVESLLDKPGLLSENNILEANNICLWLISSEKLINSKVLWLVLNAMAIIAHEDIFIGNSMTLDLSFTSLIENVLNNVSEFDD